MSSNRALYGLGAAVVGAGGYYFYTAGGDPKVAKKEVQHDAAAVAAKLKGERVSGQEVKKGGEEWAQRAGAKIDSTASDMRKKVDEADAKFNAKAGEAASKLDQLKDDSVAEFEKTRKDAGQKVDDFDRLAQKKTADAKSGISSWFGFGGK